MASILLPTTAWNDACEDVVAQATDDDEVLVLVDDAGDAVEADDREGVDRVVAGDPEGCSGKANAVAAGLEAASHDVVLATDADYDREPDWLATLREGVERHGVVTGVPVFVSDGAAGKLVEPTTTPLTLLAFGVEGATWGGALGFRREAVDVEALCADLRRTVSDDVLVAEHAAREPESVSVLAHVPVAGDVRSLLDRTTRFALTLRYGDETRVWPAFGLAAAVTAGLWVAPPATLALLHLGVLAAYYAAGLHDRGVPRWTALLALPSVYVVAALTAYGLRSSEFSWAGRRYRWPGKFDVEVRD
jgi:glycosyltransferase involved in cell wall biosynthesis